MVSECGTKFGVRRIVRRNTALPHRRRVVCLPCERDWKWILDATLVSGSSALLSASPFWVASVARSALANERDDPVSACTNFVPACAFELKLVRRSHSICRRSPITHSLGGDLEPENAVSRSSLRFRLLSNIAADWDPVCRHSFEAMNRWVTQGAKTISSLVVLHQDKLPHPV